MAEPFLGEIRIFPYNFAPTGWFMCAGQTLPISQYAALFSLLGTTYGGNGTTTFALPDLRSRVPMHFGSTYPIGTAGGTENVTLIETNLPSHNHVLNASNGAATTQNPANQYLAATGTRRGAPIYGGGEAVAVMAAGSLSNSGSSVPIGIIQPVLAVTFCIAWAGVFPSRN